MNNSLWLWYFQIILLNRLLSIFFFFNTITIFLVLHATSLGKILFLALNSTFGIHTSGNDIIYCVTFYFLHGGRDDSILSAIQAKLRSKSGHQRNSRQILQNRATELCRACAELVPKLLLRIPLYVDFLILIPLCCMSMSIIASSAYLLGP